MHKEYSTFRSDSLAITNAFNEWSAIKGRKERARYCDEHFLSGLTLETISVFRKQLKNILKDLGYICNGIDANENAENQNLLKAAIVVKYFFI